MLFRMKRCVPRPPGKCPLSASSEQLPRPPACFISSLPSLFWTRASGQGGRVCQDAFIRGQDVSMASDRTELSDTCNTPPPRPQPELPVTVLKIHLQKEPQPHMRELMNHVFLSKYHRNENVLIQGPPPPPQPSPSCFSSIRALTVPASRAEGKLRVVLPGAFFLMKSHSCWGWCALCHRMILWCWRPWLYFHVTGLWYGAEWGSVRKMQIWWASDLMCMTVL